MTTKRHIFNDVFVINKVKTGSDHRMVRGTLNINVKLERVRLVKSTLRPTRAHIQNPESFQLELQNRFDCLDCGSVNDLNNRLVVETVHTVGSKFFTHRTKKFSAHTLGLMEKRQEMRLQSSKDASEYRRINRQISKSQTNDLRHFNREKIKLAIERNKGSKVFARDLSIDCPNLMSGVYIMNKLTFRPRIARSKLF
ncbi:jg20411 [Pararge aegeria aegeria]|uniref:Jg20411 protein n=1 Tax=Pararge aegeria aegeria TaxID=348720 RepID=A0A8S4R350_9NEOP|nr:jg20411 [Pararge aegeria aegeria]